MNEIEKMTDVEVKSFREQDDKGKPVAGWKAVGLENAVCACRTAADYIREQGYKMTGPNKFLFVKHEVGCHAAGIEERCGKQKHGFLVMEEHGEIEGIAYVVCPDDNFQVPDLTDHIYSACYPDMPEGRKLDPTGMSAGDWAYADKLVEQLGYKPR